MKITKSGWSTNRDGYTIICLEDVYTLVSPDNEQQFEFLGRVEASSGIWRHLISELRDWLGQTMKDEPEGQDDGGLQDLD
jgi:hypothetical protein